jgi:uncharacterized membrane protein YfcA
MRAGLEKLLINLDIGIPGALLRIVLGFVFVSVIDVARPDAGFWMLTALLLAMLLGVKLIAAVARRVLSGSSMVRSHWEWRRKLARYYDSYQWRKLLWFGIGIVIGGVVGSPGTRAQWVLGIACTAAGAVAEIFWRRHRLGLAPQAS